MQSDRKTNLTWAGLGATIAMLRTSDALADGSRLLVFLHLAIKQRALETTLQASLGGVTVTAVGRIADFDRALAEQQDAVIALPVVLQAKGLNPSLRGYRERATDESYSLVATDSLPDPAKVASVGALDLLGRDGTIEFVHKLLGAEPKVERVTKVEDLLPLLQMQRVDAVLLPSRLVVEIQRSSRLNLMQSELATRVGLPALAQLGAAGGQIAQAIGKLPLDTSKAMGVDEWH